MFFVYSGYVSPNNCDLSNDGPCYTLSQFKTSKGVIQFKKEFEEGVDGDCCNVIFRIFKGLEMDLKPIKHEVDWELKHV